MKKILFLIALVLLLIPSISKADIANLVNNRYDNIYTYYYDASLGKTRYLEASKYSFNGKTAYCIEIGTRISSIAYNVYDDFSLAGITDDDLNYIKTISYYGYDYPSHHTDKYYLATQELIWNRLIKTNIKFTNGFNPDDFEDVENEKNEIYSLYNKHNTKPAFDGQTFDYVLGTSLAISDNNGVISMYESKTKNAYVSGNNLVINTKFSGDEVVLEKPKYANNSFLLYAVGNSQKMMSVGGIEMPSSKVKINVISGSISINKLDRDTNSKVPSGSGILEGAEYGLYNGDDNLIDTFVIGKKEKIDNLPIGRYYIKEIKASTGYLLDDNIYNVTINANNLNINLDVYEDIIKRKIDLFKVLGTNETGIMTTEEGISFEIYDEDNNLIDTIVTDDDGYASIVLPYGKYVFHQVNSSEGYYRVEDFSVNVDKSDDRPIYKLLSDSEITSKIRIIKKDMETGDNIVNSNIRFKIFDVRNNEYVSFKFTYPEIKVIDEFSVDKNGIFVTPFSLHSGDYILYEIDDKMDGYVYNKEGIPFSIDESSNFINDDDYGLLLEIPFYNKRVTGKIIINKYGEDIVYADNMYYYKDIYLDCVNFELYARNNIYSNGKLIYKEDDLIEKCTTDDGGICEFDNLPLGEYYVKEVKSNYNNIIDKEIYDIVLKYKDQYTDKIIYEQDVFNYLKKGKITINKYEKDSDIRLANTLIEIRNSDDIVIYKGYTNSNGQIVIDDLLYGDYYISEIEASTGYRILEDKVYFTLDKEEINIDIYNDIIEVPNTGIDISVFNILLIITMLFGIISIIMFWENKKIVIFSIIVIMLCFSYFGIYFYRYLSDDYKNDKASNDFFDSNIDDNYDEKYRYTSLIEIPSIGLKRGILDIDNKYNDVNYNIELIKKIDNKLVLASHNGNYYYSYFDKLKDMELSDYINYYDNGLLYRYVYTESYVIKKDGTAGIYCKRDEKCIALVTCLEGNDNAQIVYIGYLDSIEHYENRE